MVDNDKAGQLLNSSDRRQFVKAAGLTGLAAMSGCLGGAQSGGSGNVADEIANAEPADSINAIFEDLPATAAIKEFSSQFTEQTGIEVNITLLPYGNMVERINQQFAAGSANFDAVYSDPYANTAVYPNKHVPLRTLHEHEDLESVPNGFDDFFKTQLITDAIFEDDGEPLTLPYDSSTVMLAYRRDIINKYADEAEDDLGFPFKPGPERTWDEYIEMGRWMNENVSEVEAGIGHTLKQHDALQLDFNSFFWAHGGENIEGYSGHIDDGAAISFPDDPTPSHATEGRAGMTGPEILDKYKELAEVAHPSSPSWAYGGIISAFGQGDQFAMGPIVHEVANAYEAEGSAVKGKVEWTLLPQGAHRSVTHFGGTGLGVNADSSPAKQHAAWKFIVWATSTQLQVQTLKNSAGSFTRKSTWNHEDIREARNKEPWNSSIPNVAQPLRRAWQPANMGLRPHTAEWNELKQSLFTEVSKAISGKDSKQAMEDLDDAWADALS